MYVALLAVVFSVSGPDDNSDLDRSGGVYCGIYSVYGALQAIGIDLDFQTLLEKKYVGSQWGSSLAELREAVEEAGGEATSLEGLSADSLRLLSSPLILHVRPPGLETEYSHWVLVLGTRNGKAIVVDAPEPAYEMDVGQLLAASDGKGLYVSRRGEGIAHLVFTSRFALVPHLAGMVLCMAILSYLASRFRWTRSKATAAILLTVAVVATAEHLRADGFLRNRPAVAYVQGRQFTPVLPEVSPAEVRSFIEAKSVTIVDARYPSDFLEGHLPGAINIPIFSGMVRRDRAAKDLIATKTVVVYCQGSSCRWGDSLAADLALRGVPDVRLMREGWEGWESLNAAGNEGQRR